MIEKEVTINPNHDVVIPNAFTPNQSGSNGGQYDPTDLSNDVFYPFADYIKDFHMMIFNRWGELIFDSNSIEIGWDGYYKGQLCKQDVYVWLVKGRFNNGKPYRQAGDITLLH